MKAQKRTVGSIVKVPLKNGEHTYARILKSPFFAFYDSKSKIDISDLNAIIRSKVLFITAVSNYAVTQGFWQKIGQLPLETELQTIPPFFKQDALQPTQFSIIYEDGTSKNATKEECIGLERMAVWTPDSIQDRLNDYYSGKKHYFVKEMENPETWNQPSFKMQSV